LVGAITIARRDAPAAPAAKPTLRSTIEVSISL
jgi:hypothetical protein